MDRSLKRTLLIVGAVFLGFYLLSNNLLGGHIGGHWYPVMGLPQLPQLPWLKWALLGIGIWYLISVCSGGSSQSRRNYRSYYSGYRRSRNKNSDQADIHEKMDLLREELAELRREKTKTESSTSSKNSPSFEQRFDALTERIVTLEKIVTDRRYQLDEEIEKLK